MTGTPSTAGRGQGRKSFLWGLKEHKLNHERWQPFSRKGDWSSAWGSSISLRSCITYQDRFLPLAVTTGRLVSGEPSGDGSPKRCFRLPQGDCRALHHPNTPPLPSRRQGHQAEAVFLRTCHIYPHRNLIASIAVEFVFPICRYTAVVSLG